MVVTELVSQSPIDWSNAWAFCSTARDRWPCAVSGDASRVSTTKIQAHGGIRTLNMYSMVVTELVTQLPMAWSKI
jgi:hypothetical protein